MPGDGQNVDLEGPPQKVCPWKVPRSDIGRARVVMRRLAEVIAQRFQVLEQMVIDWHKTDSVADAEGREVKLEVARSAGPG